MTIIFLSTYLLSSTMLSELLALPILIEHYIEHKSQNNAISFGGFLEMHYAHGNVKDADYDKDMKLPFKTVNINNSTPAICYSPNFTYSLQKPMHLVVFKQNFLPRLDHFSSNYLDAIWQPPRFV